MVGAERSQRRSRSGFLLFASAAVAAATGFGSVVSFVKNVPGEPLGIKMKLTVADSLKVGLGTGLAAPWPMPVVALSAAIAGWWRDRVGGPARIGQTVGMMLVLGSLVEPVTWGRRSRSPIIWAAVAANLVAGATLALAGRRASLRSTN